MTELTSSQIDEIVAAVITRLQQSGTNIAQASVADLADATDLLALQSGTFKRVSATDVTNIASQAATALTKANAAARVEYGPPSDKDTTTADFYVSDESAVDDVWLNQTSDDVRIPLQFRPDHYYDISWIKNYTTNDTLTSTQSEELNYLITAHSDYYTNAQYERSLAWVWADDTYFHVVNAFGEHWIIDGHVQGLFEVVSKETNFWNSLYANIATTTNLTTAISGQLKRNLYTSFGATYNTTTKRYELNGLTDITEAEMDVIFKLTHDFRLCGSLRTRFMLQTHAGFRTNLFPYSNPVYFSATSDARYDIDCYQMCYNCNRLESFRVSADLTASVPTRGLQVSNCAYMFYGCQRLKTILGVINIQHCTNAAYMFGLCSALQSVNIAGVRCNIDLSACTQITKASVLFMIENSTVTASVQATITLAASVYDTLIEDTDINNAIAAKGGNIFLASA